MHAFGLVVAKPGRAIAPSVMEVLGARSPAELPFTADAHVRWSDDRGRTVFGGWQVGASALGVGSHWEIRPTGLTAFSGHLWPQGSAWAAGPTWAAQLADRFDRVPLVASLETHQGVYTATSVSSNGTGCVTSDPLGFGALYWAESDDLVVVSNRSSLAARLVTPTGRCPTRDVEGAASVAYCTYAMSDRTGFAGVSTIPPGSYLALSPDAAPRIRTWSATPWMPTVDVDAHDRTALVAGVRDELAASVRALATVPAATKMANLTGGRDTRLVLGLLLSEGLADQFTYNTFGSAALPDCVVATAIADRFGLDHRAASRSAVAGAARAATPGAASSRPAPRPATYADRLRHHVWLTSGMLSTWDLRNLPQRPSSGMVLTGLFGETFRTIYHPKPRRRSWRAPLRKAPPLLAATMDDLREQVYGTGHGFDAARIFKPEAREHFDAQVAKDLIASLPENGDPKDALDGFYLAGRLRRWFGPQPDTDTHHRVYPLYSLGATRATFALGPDARWSEVLPFELMRATCEELASMPFAQSAWPEELSAFVPDAQRFRAAPVTPATPLPPRQSLRARPEHKMQTVNQEHQSRAGDDKVRVLREQLDLGADHALFDLIDRPALLEALDRFGELGVNARRGVHGAVTAAMWLGGAEARYCGEGEPGPGAPAD